MLVAAGATLVVIPAGIWAGRYAIGEFAVGQFCAGRDLSCDLSIEKLSLNEVSVRGIKIEKPGADPVSIEQLDVELSWPKLFSPLLTSVTATRPEVTVDARNGELHVALLEAFQTEGGDGGDINLPPFSITDGRVTILTDAGPVQGVVNTAGAFNREVRSSLKLMPAELSLEDHRLSLQGGEAELVLTSTRVSGEFSLQLSHADLQGFEAEDIVLLASIEPIDDQNYRAEWQVSSATVVHDLLNASGLESRGYAQLRFGGKPGVETAEIISGAAELQADTISTGGASMDAAALTIDLSSKGDGLSGPLSLEAGNVRYQDKVNSETLLLTGNLSLNERRLMFPAGHFSGAVTVSGGEFDDSLQQTIYAAMSLPTPLTQHGEALKDTAQTLLSGFDTGTMINIDFSLAAPSVVLLGQRATTLRTSDQNIAVSILPDGGDNWLEYADGVVSMRGELQILDETNGLDLTSDRFSLQMNTTSQDMEISMSGVALSPWNVEEKKLDLDLSSLRFAREAGDLRFSTKGQVRFSGEAFGADLEALTVIGSFAGLDTGGGWNIRLNEKDCFSYGAGLARFGDAEIGPVQGDLCADDGRLFSRSRLAGKDVLKGQLHSDELVLPIAHPAFSGRLTYEAPVIDWTLSDGFSMQLASTGAQGAIELPSTGDDPSKTVNMGAKSFRAELDAGTDPVAVTINVKDANVSMTDMPVSAVLTEWSAEGALGASGPELEWTALGLQIFDAVNPANNALFEPMMTSGSGRLTSAEVSYEGRLRLAADDGDFGTVTFVHDISSGEGSVQLLGGSLQFARKGLQFYDVSERLRGLAVNASGTIRPEVNVSWKGADLSAAAKVELQNVSFSTYRLGQFRDLSGTLEVSDLIAMRTPPHQYFTLDALEISPSVTLEDGEMYLQVINPNLVHLESAKWPFVGGELSIDPAFWAFDSERQKLTVRAEKWSLERLINLFKISDLDIKGTASGEFPIEIIGPDIFLRDAQLTAIDDGLVSYTGATGSQAATANDYAKMTFDALSNFEYKVLSLGANGNLLDDILLELTLQGHNPDVLDGQEFIINIALQSKLIELIRGGTYAASADATRKAAFELIRDNHAESSD